MNQVAARAEQDLLGVRPNVPPFADLELIEASFEQAVRATSERLERRFTIAGRIVAFRSASEGVQNRLTRAFSHLEAPGGATPQLTINLWDSAARSTASPPVPSAEGEQAPGAFFYYSDERVRVGYQIGTSGDRRVLDVYSHDPTPALSVLDTERDTAWYWVEDSDRIPYWEEATPFRYILDWWLRAGGLHYLHAGSVGLPDGGVLVVGKSGSGKSTSTLATLDAGLRYAGDDYVAIGLEPEPWVHSLYSSGKLMPDHVQRLPFLLPALANTKQLDVEKALVYVDEHWPGAITAGFPLKAILVPRVVPGLRESRVVEASRLVGLTALAPSTVFQLHTRGQDSLARMSRLVERAPSFVLELGSSMDSTPRAIEGLLLDLTARRG